MHSSINRTLECFRRFWVWVWLVPKSYASIWTTWPYFSPLREKLGTVAKSTWEMITEPHSPCLKGLRKLHQTLKTINNIIKTTWSCSYRLLHFLTSFFFFVVWGTKPRTWHMLGNHSTTEPLSYIFSPRLLQIFSFPLLWHWGLNSEPRAYEADALPLKAYHHPFMFC
jgi:hypothetical protein